jgi:hypothetical protein
MLRWRGLLVGAVIGFVLPTTGYAVVLTPTQTANLSANSPDTPSPGGINEGGYLTVNYTDGTFNYGLLQFDVSSFLSPIADATLELFHRFNQTSATFGLFNNTSAWDQNTVTFNTAPSHDPTSVSQLLITDAEGSYESFNVTSIVNQWISGSVTNDGLSFIRTDDTNPVLYFDATNSQGDGPLLEIDAAATPLPATWTMMLIGLGGFVITLHRRRRQDACPDIVAA